MNKKTIMIILVLGLCLICAGCQSSEPTEGNIRVLTIWDADEITGNNHALDFDDAYGYIQDQRRGFIRGMEDFQKNFELNEYLVSERLNLDTFTTKIADLYNNKEILVAVGASSEDMSMDAAKETEFFSIPFLVPFSDGVVSEGTNSYLMRMTPSITTYAEYLGTVFYSDLRTTLNMLLFGNDAVPDYSISTAFFFENGLNGHEIAVNITQNLMDAGLDIEIYQPYQEDYLFETFQNISITNSETLQGLDLIFLYAEDDVSLTDLSRIMSIWDNRETPPLVIVIGYTSNEVSPDLEKYNNLLFLQQSLDASNCPADISNTNQRLGYAAGYILSDVMNRAVASQGSEQGGIRTWFSSSGQKAHQHQEYISSFRNNIQMKFMEYNENVPCYGNINFNGVSTVDLKLFSYHADNQIEEINPERLLGYMIDRIQQKTGGSR